MFCLLSLPRWFVPPLIFLFTSLVGTAQASAKEKITADCFAGLRRIEIQSEQRSQCLGPRDGAVMPILGQVTPAQKRRAC